MNWRAAISVIAVLACAACGTPSTGGAGGGMAGGAAGGTGGGTAGGAAGGSAGGSLGGGSAGGGSAGGGSTGGGSTGGGSTGGGSAGGGSAAFTLTSTQLSESGTFPVRFTCTDTTTMGLVSLPLTWTASPLAQSYAVTLTDKSNNLIHWIIFNIPSSATALPEGVQNVAMPANPAGAKQVKSYDNTTYGYKGPCPPSVHTYQFVVSALDVATLPGVTTTSTRADVATAMAPHVKASAPLTGTYGP